MTGAAGHMPSMDSLRLPVWDVRVELGRLVSDQEVRDDLDGGLAHHLEDLDPHVGVGRQGRAELALTVPGPDVWSSTLAAMAVLARCGYDLHALHVQSREEPDRTSAA